VPTATRLPAGFRLAIMTPEDGVSNIDLQHRDVRGAGERMPTRGAAQSRRESEGV